MADKIKIDVLHPDISVGINKDKTPIILEKGEQSVDSELAKKLISRGLAVDPSSKKIVATMKKDSNK